MNIEKLSRLSSDNLSLLKKFFPIAAAIAVGSAAVFINIEEHLLLIAIILISVAAVTLAFHYQDWALIALLAILIPTTDAQIAQTPFLVPGTNFPISYIDPLLLSIFVLWFLAILFGVKKVYRHPLNLPFLFLSLTILLAILLGLFNNARPGDVVIGVRPTLAYFLAFVSVSAFQTRKQIIRFVSLILIIILSISIWGIFISVTGRGTVVSTNFGILAIRNFQGAQSGYLTIGLMLALSLLSYQKKAKNRWLAGIFAVVIGAAVLVSFVRGNWVAVLMSTLFLIVLLPGRLRLRFVFTMTLTSLLLVTILSTATVFLPQEIPLLGVARERFLSIFFPTASTRATYEAAFSRVHEWVSGLRLIAESPIIGHGYGRYFSIIFERGEPTVVRGFHNSYLTIAYTNGLLGLGAFIWLSISFLTYARRLIRQMNVPLDRGITAGLATAYFATMVASTFTFYLFDMVNIAPFLGISMGIVIALGRITNQEANPDLKVRDV